MEHPYLLRESYESLGHQVKFRDKTRADIVFYGSPTLVVELKKTQLRPKDVNQVAGYMKDLRDEGYAPVEGMLVGLDYDEKVEAKIAKTDLVLSLKKLGTDVPTELQKCSRCDRFCGTNNSRCPYCGGKQMRYWDSIEGKLI